MKKFRFALQSLLDLRAKKLEEKQIEFGKLQFILRSMQTELANMQEDLSRSNANLANLMADANDIDIGLIGMTQRYNIQLKQNILLQMKKINQHEICLKAKQMEMLEALKEKTMLDKLKEKQLKVFLKTIDEAEKKELDEIGLMRAARHA